MLIPAADHESETAQLPFGDVQPVRSELGSTHRATWRVLTLLGVGLPRPQPDERTGATWLPRRAGATRDHASLTAWAAQARVAPWVPDNRGRVDQITRGSASPPDRSMHSFSGAARKPGIVRRNPGKRVFGRPPLPTNSHQRRADRLKPLTQPGRHRQALGSRSRSPSHARARAACHLGPARAPCRPRIGATRFAAWSCRSARRTRPGSRGLPPPGPSPKAMARCASPTTATRPTRLASQPRSHRHAHPRTAGAALQVALRHGIARTTAAKPQTGSPNRGDRPRPWLYGIQPMCQHRQRRLPAPRPRSQTPPASRRNRRTGTTIIKNPSQKAEHSADAAATCTFVTKP